MTFIERYIFDVFIYFSTYENKIQSNRFPEAKSFTQKLSTSEIPKLIYLSYLLNNKKEDFNNLIKDIERNFIDELNNTNKEFVFKSFFTFFHSLKIFTHYDSYSDKKLIKQLNKFHSLNYNQFNFLHIWNGSRTTLLKYYYYEQVFEKYIPNLNEFLELKKLENKIYDNTFLFLKLNRKDIQRKIEDPIAVHSR